MSYNFKKNLLALTITLSIGLGLVTMPHISRGAETTSDGKYTVLAPLPCIEGNGISCDAGNGSLVETVDFKTYVQYTFNLLIALSAAVAVVQLVWGGLEYIITTSVTNKKSSLDRAKNAIIGLVLVLTSFIILRTVDPRLTEIPNTLVPEITFNSYLTRDAYNILIDKVNNDTTNLEAENARQIKMARENKDKQDATLQKIKDIDNQISKLNPNNASDKQKIESLQRDRAKLKSQNDLERVQTETSKFTSQISEYLMLTGAQFAQPVDMKNSKEVSKLMAQLSSNQENLIMSRDARLSQLSDIENTDTKTIEQLAVYGASMIELDKIRLTNASARQVTVGATYNTKIQTSVINPDAQLQISNGSEIKQMLLNKINDIEVKSRVLDSNDTYFVKLTNEIMDARDKINNNNSYK